MKFGFDECIPIMMGRAIQALTDGKPYEVVCLAVEYGKSTKDVPLIERFARDGGTIFISGDLNIRRRYHELLALERSGLVSFFMDSRWTNVKMFPKAAHLVHWWPEIERYAASARAGDSWEVPYVREYVEMRRLHIPDIMALARKQARRRGSP